MADDVHTRKLMASDADNQSHPVPVLVPMTTIPSLPDNASLSPVLHSPLNRYIPVSPLSARPTSHQPHSLEDIIERNVAMSIFALFFDYVGFECFLSRIRIFFYSIPTGGLPQALLRQTSSMLGRRLIAF